MNNYNRITLENTGNGVYHSFFLCDGVIHHFVTGGNTCSAVLRDHVEEKVGHRSIKGLYSCKKHNTIAKQLTGLTLTEMRFLNDNNN